MKSFAVVSNSFLHQLTKPQKKTRNCHFYGKVNNIRDFDKNLAVRKIMKKAKDDGHAISNCQFWFGNF